MKARDPERLLKGPGLGSGRRFCSLLPLTHFTPHFPKSTQAPLLAETAVTAAAAKVEAEAVTPRGLLSMPGWMKGKAGSGESGGAPRAQKRPTAAVPGQLVLEALLFLVGPVWGWGGKRGVTQACEWAILSSLKAGDTFDYPRCPEKVLGSQSEGGDKALSSPGEVQRSAMGTRSVDSAEAGAVLINSSSFRSARPCPLPRFANCWFPSPPPRFANFPETPLNLARESFHPHHPPSYP